MLCGVRWSRSFAVLAAVVLLAVSSPAPPAGAHDTDPRVVTTLDAITPPLPPGIVVQTRAGVAEEVMAQNPTTTPLLVVGAGNRAFLRISARGVDADLSSADWYLTNSPTGTAIVPRAATPQAPARWVKVSTANSWSWYDHRLHPQPLDLPASVTSTTRLGDWQIPVDYEGSRSIVSGHTDVLPAVGAFTVSSDAAPTGLVASVLPGRLPGLFLTDPGGLPTVVFGSDGKIFFRMDQRGVEVDEGSPNWVEDQRARGNPVPVVASRPHWRRISTAPSVSWLDPRLRYPRDVPRDPETAADVQRWTIPMTFQGRRAALTGLIRWTPAAHAGRPASGRSRTFTVIGIGLLVLAAAIGASAIQRTRHRRPRLPT